MPKYFVTPDSVKDNEIFIEGDDAKHIGTVLRAKTGLLCATASTEIMNV